VNLLVVAAINGLAEAAAEAAPAHEADELRCLLVHAPAGRAIHHEGLVLPL
jgi:hypothetical protein